jgi:hypothetical protein
VCEFGSIPTRQQKRRLDFGSWARAKCRMLYVALRLLHLAAMILWLGGGLSVPVVADIRRTLEAGLAGGAALSARLRTTTLLVVPSAVVVILSGVALLALRYGFSGAPHRFHLALALALSIFVVGGTQSAPAIKALERAFASADQAAAERAGKKLIRCLRVEDLLRVSVLLLMVLPI